MCAVSMLFIAYAVIQSTHSTSADKIACFPCKLYGHDYSHITYLGLSSS